MYRFHEQADGSTHRVAVPLCRLMQDMQSEVGLNVEPTDTAMSAWKVAAFGAAISELCAASTNEFIGMEFGARLALEPEVIATINGAKWENFLDLLGLMKKFHAVTGITISTSIIFERDECVLDASLPYQYVPDAVLRFAMQACLSLVCVSLLRCGLAPEAIRCIDSQSLQSRQPIPPGWSHIPVSTLHSCRMRFCTQALLKNGRRVPAAPLPPYKTMLPKVFARSPLLFQVEHALTNSETLLDAKQLCQQLGISHATLHRALKNSGTHFRVLLDREKLQRATYWLSVQQVSIEETAERLGYSDASNFRRAFKKWAGCCPSEIRAPL